ncbi:oxidoreductase [Bombardia bombarda]|uniref:Oxidoreductase n=1 Tax=Bombardia bombarda TaxID=252184 RepID=A0AA39WI31_9PEZI|nr:oxidoreductase [Bombardia bombarda]
MSRPWILLCPSSRGIGHALTRHLLRSTDSSIPIFATSRSSDTAAAKKKLLHGLDDGKTSAMAKRLEVVQLDVTDESSVSAAAHHAASLFPHSSHHLHLAFALPGILHPEKSPAQVDYGRALETFRVNALGPLLLMKWFEEFLPRKSTQFHLDDQSGGGSDGNMSLPSHAVWVSMSARVGSVSDNKLGGWYSYRSSKAAVNSLTKSFDYQLHTRSGDKAMAVAYHPGTVKTDLSKAFWGSVANDRLFEPEDAVDKMARLVMAGLGVDKRGRCWDYNGDEVPP